MKSLLEALEAGRLVELPADCGKDAALELLANLIEAVPDIGARTDLVASVKERESRANTGLGRGVACPHCRTSLEGELLCALGWSPKGMEYGAADGAKVHLVVMYYVPDRERNTYLKEVSGLAKAVSSGDAIEAISSFPDIHTVRDKLLDWVALVISAESPGIKARMIKLEARQAAATAGGSPGGRTVPGAASRIVPFRLVVWPSGSIVLCQDPVLARALEGIGDLGERILGSREFAAGDWRVAVLSETPYSGDRREYEAFAFEAEGDRGTGPESAPP